MNGTAPCEKVVRRWALRGWTTFILLALVFLAGWSLYHPPTVLVRSSQNKLRQHLLSEAVLLLPRDVERVLDEAQRKHPDEQLPTVKPQQFITWVKRYIADDMDDFVFAVLERLPSQNQAAVRRRLYWLSITPQLNVAYLGEETVGLTHGLDVTLDPSKIATYAELRHVFSHELVHYFFQKQRDPRNRAIIEGITEFLTVRAADDLVWDLSHLRTSDVAVLREIAEIEAAPDKASSIGNLIALLARETQCYPVESGSASLLLALDTEHKLLTWYTGSEDTNPATTVFQLLVAHRVPKTAAQEWVVDLRAASDLYPKAIEKFQQASEAFEESEHRLEKVRVFRHAVEHFEALLYARAHIRHVRTWLAERNFTVPPRPEWEEFLASINEDVLKKQNPKLTCPEPNQLAFYTDNLVPAIPALMYGDSLGEEKVVAQAAVKAVANAEGPLALEQCLVCIDVALTAMGFQVASGADSGQTLDNVRDRALAELVTVDQLITQGNGLVGQANAEMKTWSLHHWRLAELLAEREVDVVAMLKDTETPTYYQQLFLRITTSGRKK